MKLYWRMGWRNIWRNRRRSIITLSALGFSVALLVFFIGFMESYMKQMEENVIGLSLGHVQVHHPDFLADQNLYQVVENSDRLAAAIRDEGLAAAERSYGYGLLASDRTTKSAGVRLKGIDLAHEAAVTELDEPKMLLEGAYLSGSTREYEPPKEDLADQPVFEDPLGDDLGFDLEDTVGTLTVGEMVLGRKLAENLGARPGDTVSVVTMAADGTLGNELFDVVGVFKNFSDIDDRSLALVSLADYRRLFNLPAGEAHEIAVRIPAGMEPTSARTVVTEIVGGAGDVRTWREIEPAMAEMIEYGRNATLLFALTMYLGAAMLIMNSMLMMVFERIREFGVMKAIGLRGSKLMVLVYFETFWMCILASIAGLAVGVPLTHWVGRRGMDLSAMAPNGFSISGTVLDPVMYAEVTPVTVLLPVVSLFVISFVSVLYPAIKAAVIEPVKALYYL